MPIVRRVYRSIEGHRVSSKAAIRRRLIETPALLTRGGSTDLSEMARPVDRACACERGRLSLFVDHVLVGFASVRDNRLNVRVVVVLEAGNQLGEH